MSKTENKQSKCKNCSCTHESGCNKKSESDKKTGDK